MAGGRMWEEWEDAIIRELYPEYGWAACLNKLPDRTKCAIVHRATTTLGLSWRFARDVRYANGEIQKRTEFNPIPLPPDTRDLWARMMGDPRPGQSALDMRNG